MAATVRSLLERFAPAIAARVRPEFSVRGPRDLLAGALTPIVRKAWASLPDGHVAMAIGDAWITNDPLTGQGANIASHCAWTLAAAIERGGPFDEAFAARVEDEMWSYAGVCTKFTNAFLQPPPEHVVALLAAAARDQAIADRFARMLHYPVDGWALISDPKATMDLIAKALPA
jgi:2-polyprenyl-6-methoxyphenol hydroxylase-like FAD-dependent oxidoreductase